MRVLIYSPGPPSRSDALLRQLADYLLEKGHLIGWRYFGAYMVPEDTNAVSSDFENADVVVTVGWNNNINQIHKDQRRACKPSVSISDGFVKRGWNSGAYFAATRNGLHAYGDRVAMLPGDRWKKLDVKLMPWRKQREGQFILIAHQHTVTFDNRSRQPYFDNVLKMVKEYCPTMEIVIRLHPRDRSMSYMPKNVVISTRPLIDDLMNAWAVVTYDSNIAVDATLFGVPCFTNGKTMADPIVCRDIAKIVDPPMPDRQQWAHDLAYSQWSVNELRAGFPWAHLVDGFFENKPSGFVDCVDVPAVESDYPYESVPEAHLASLTNWNGKDGQTPTDVLKEISNPRYADAIKVRRDKFTGMDDIALKQEAEKLSLEMGSGYNRNKLINRLIHATL